MGAVAYPVEGVLHRDGVEVGERPSAVLVAVRPEAVVVDVGVLLADRAEGALSAGIAQGIDEPTISLLIVGLLANVIFLTFIAAIVGREVGLWETLPVVTAIVWALTTGFSLLLHLGELLEADNAFRSRVFRILGPSTVVAEIVGVSVLAFWWELLLIPILFVLVIAVYANRSTVLTIVSSALLMAYAVGLISGVIIDLVNDPGTWRSVTQAILLPIALTVGTLSYIQLLVLVQVG